MKVIQTLISAIPKFSQFSMRFHYNFSNWLPFYWAGYKQTTRYTYLIKNLTDLNNVYKGFSYEKRADIRKAEQLVKIYEDLSPEEFYANHKFMLRKQGQPISYSYHLFKRIYEAAITHSAGKIWCAKDENWNIHAAIFVIYDSKSAYYLINAIDRDFPHNNASALLIKEAIKHVSKYTQRFDFEGSMIQGVEKSNRFFGGIQTPYFSISKDNRSVLLKMIDELRTGLGNMLDRFGDRKRPS